MNARWIKRRLAHVTPSTVALLVAAVLVMAGSVALVVREPAPPSGGTDTTALPRPHAEPIAQRPHPIKGDRALIVGDSYAAGVGATGGNGYAQQLAADLGWKATIRSTPGGGYGKPGVDGVSVLDLLKRADLPTYDVVVVQSGYNDVSEDDAAVARAVAQAAALLRREARGVPVVVVGEFWPGKPTPSSQARAQTIASVWQDRAGVVFLNPIAGGWSDFDTVDDRHPDDAGHALIAAKIEAGMRRAGLLGRSGSE